MIEVMVDQLAAELGMDRLELRRKNFIPTEDFPARGRARRRLRLRQLPRRAGQAARARRPRRGPARAGASCAPRGKLPRRRLLAPTRRSAAWRRRASTGPSGFGLQAGLLGVGDGARAHRRGAVTVFTGTSPHGQGLETTFAQIVADRLGIDPAQRRGHPRRHRHRPVRAGHLRLALAGRRRRGGRPRDGDKVADKAQADRRPPARGGARGHRARATASSRSRARRTRA